MLAARRITQAHTGGLAAGRVVDNFVHNAVGANGQVARLARHRQCRRQAAEIGSVWAAANAPVAGQTLAAMAAVNFWVVLRQVGDTTGRDHAAREFLDRKSTRLNSSHVAISYAVFCLQK